MTTTPEEFVLSKQGVAKLLKVSLRAVEDWTDTGLLPSVKLGGRQLYLRQAVILFLRSVSDLSTAETTDGPR